MMKQSYLRLLLSVCLLCSSLIGLSQNGIVRSREYFYGLENHTKCVTGTLDRKYAALQNSSYDVNSAIVKYDSAFNILWTANLGWQLDDMIQTADSGFIACGLRAFGRPVVYSEDFWIIKLNKSGAVEWMKNYGGTKQDYSHAIRQKQNGNYIISGITNSIDGEVIGKALADLADVWVIELDGNGNLVNQKVLDVVGSDSYFATIDVTNDGGVIVAATTAITTGPNDILLYKLAPDLSVQWSRIIGGSGQDIPSSIYENENGEFILAGSGTSTDGDIITADGINSDGFIMKLNASGNIIWTKIIGGGWQEGINKAKPLAGGDIIVAGTSNSDPSPGFPLPVTGGSQDPLIFRLDANGNKIWGRRLGGTDNDNVFDITESAHNTFVICGMKMETTGGDYTGILGAGPGGFIPRGYILELRNLQNKIKGVVYNDINNNKIIDAGERVNYIPVNVTEDAFGINEYPVDGNFSFSLDTGNYVTSLLRAHYIDTTFTAISPKRKYSVLSAPGQTDSFAIRLLAMPLVEDLQVFITKLSGNWLDHSVKYRVKLRNAGGKTISNPQVKIKADNLLYHSSAKPVSSTSGDTLIWNLAPFPGLFSDSFDITMFAKTLPEIQPGDTARLLAIAEPYATDFDTLDNVLIHETILQGQNTAIAGLMFSAYAPDSARFKRTIPIFISYNYNSLLDSTNGTVRFVKNPNASFVSAIPAPSVIDNDTLTWNFKELSLTSGDTITVNLKIVEGGGAQPGDLIHFSGKLTLHTADTTELVREFSLTKMLSGYFVEPDTITTSLQLPQGIRWTRAFGGSGSDYAYHVLALPDSGFIIAGATSSKDGDIGHTDSSLNGLLARYDKDGHLIWKQVLGGTMTDAFYEVQMVSPGIFYAVGALEDGSGGNAWLVKFNLNGDIIWNRNYGGSSGEQASSVLPAADGGCYILAQTMSDDGDVHDYEPPPTGDFFPVTMWLVKLDANGTLQWDSCYSGQKHAYGGVKMKRTNDNRIIVVGTAYDTIRISDVTNSGLVFLLNNDGTRVMEKVISVPGLDHNISGVVVNADNSFTFAGEASVTGAISPDTTYSGIHGGTDFYTGRIDAAGNLLWEKYFGGSGYDFGRDISIAADGNYLVAGFADSHDGNVTGVHPTDLDGWLLKVDPSGNLLWQKTIGGSDEDVLHSAAELADQSIMAVGHTMSDDGDMTINHGDADLLLAKLGVSNFIIGTVYIDLNNNGIQDPAEPVFKKGTVKAVSSTREYSGIVIDGLYQVSVDTGDYVVKLYMADSAYYNVIPVSANISFDELSQTAVANFRLVKKADINDLRLNILPLGIARPGFTIYYRVNYENKGTIASATPVTIRLKLDEKLTYLSSTIAHSSVVGDTLVWTLPAPGMLEVGSFDITVRVAAPPVVNNGDSLVIYGEILPIEIDTTPYNNISRVKQFVQGSYDPNDKIEVHGNNLPFNFIENEEYMTYVIRFQNTGTDTAFNVYVRDTLSDKFDWSSFEMIDASHPYELSVQGGNSLEWYFRDIYLVDSNRNEPASHGFIAFRIKPRSDLQIGDSVTNDAGIYFDFNLPVQTNLMLSTIGPSAALPSTILGLSARWKDESGVELKWLVVNEYKVLHYEVEHSANGIEFNAAGQVAATNDQFAHTYEFIHRGALPGNNYYRLKVVDIDGHIAYSKTILLIRDVDLLTSMKIYPVPAANETINVLIEGVVKGMGSLSIYGMNGALIKTMHLGNIDQPNYRLTLNTNTFNKGTYILHITIGDKLYRGKLIIR